MPLDLDKLHEECGLYGIYDRDGLDVVEQTCIALYALQHRGQESAGIAVYNNGTVTSHKDLGLVPEVFPDKILKRLGTGTIAMGHVRYTAGGRQERANAQPLVMRYVKGTFAIGHNGTIANAGQIKHEREQGGSIFQTTCDAELIAYLIARERLTAGTLERAV
jgi:amidophosphoribosyltransferase